MNEQFQEFLRVLNEASEKMSGGEEPLAPAPPESKRKAAQSAAKKTTASNVAGAVISDKRILEAVIARQTLEINKVQGKIEKHLNLHAKQLTKVISGTNKTNLVLDKLLKQQITFNKEIKKAFATPISVSADMAHSEMEEIDIDFGDTKYNSTPTSGDVIKQAVHDRRAARLKGTTENTLLQIAQNTGGEKVVRVQEKNYGALEDIKEELERYHNEALHRDDLDRDAREEAEFEESKRRQQEAKGNGGLIEQLKRMKDAKDASGEGWSSFLLGGIQALVMDRLFGGIIASFKSAGGLKGLIKNPTGMFAGLKPVFTSLGSMFGGLKGLTDTFKKVPGLGKALGLFKGIGGKILLPLAVVMGIVDFFMSFFNASKVLNKSKDKITFLDRISSGVGGLLGGIVGIIDAAFSLFGIDTNVGGTVKKLTANTLSNIFELVSEVGKLVFAPLKGVFKTLKMLPWKELVSGVEFLSDTVLKPLTKSLRMVNSLLEGKGPELETQVQGIDASFTPFSKTLNTFRKLLDRMSNVLGFRSLQSAVDYAEFRIEKTSTWVHNTLSEVGAVVQSMFNMVKMSFSIILSQIGNEMAKVLGYENMYEAFAEIKNRFVTVFQGIGAGIAKLLGFEQFDDLINRVLQIRDLLMKPFEIIIEKVSKFLKGLNKVAGWMGYDSKEFEAWEKAKNAQRTSATKEVADAKAAAVAASQTGAQQPQQQTRAVASASPEQQETTTATSAFMRPIMSKVTSQFGGRRNPFGANSSEFHKGQDYAGNYGDPIRAAGDGVVQVSGHLRGYGNAVYINHDNGYQTRYGHMQSLSPYSIGSRVKAGDVIGEVGSTGRSSGPHLHFEVRRGWSLDNRGTPVDPEQFFRSAEREDQTAMRVPSVRPDRPMNQMRRVSTGYGMGTSAVTNIPGQLRTVGAGKMMAPSLNDIAMAAVDVERKTGLPAQVLMAQWAVESGWGKKQSGDFNYFGITKGARHQNYKVSDTEEDITWDQLQKFSPDERSSARNLDGTPLTQWEGKKKIGMSRKFASYGSMEEAMADYAHMMTKRGNYATAFERYKIHGNPEMLVNEIAGTYATDRNYADLVNRVANQGNVQSALTLARNEEHAPPRLTTPAQTPATALAKNTKENENIKRQQNTGDQKDSRNVNIASSTVNNSNSTFVADLKPRNTENTHQRLMNRDHVRT